MTRPTKVCHFRRGAAVGKWLWQMYWLAKIRSSRARCVFGGTIISTRWLSRGALLSAPSSPPVRPNFRALPSFDPASPLFFLRSSPSPGSYFSSLMSTRAWESMICFIKTASADIKFHSWLRRKEINDLTPGLRSKSYQVEGVGQSGSPKATLLGRHDEQKKKKPIRFLRPLLHVSISRKECVENIIDGGKSTYRWEVIKEGAKLEFIGRWRREECNYTFDVIPFPNHAYV